MIALSLAGAVSFACGARKISSVSESRACVASRSSTLHASGAAAQPPACRGDCYFVDARSGSDGKDGRSAATAFATLGRAAQAVRPGSTVLVMSGTYTSDGSSPPLTISTSGEAGAWITFQAAPGQSPVIQIPRGPGASSGIHLPGSAYIVLDGFEVVGQNGSITPEEGAQNDGSQTVLNEVCVFVDGMGTAQGMVPHDIVIRNMSVHDCSGAGIGVVVADAITISNNVVYDNAWWSVDSMSGIEFYHLTDVAGSGTSEGGYKNVVSGNVVYGNENRVPWPFGVPVAIYDGNGIIFDDGDHKQPAVSVADVQGVPYTGRSWAVNNIVHDNGGRGIHAFSSSHIDIVNNTVWNDLLTSSPYLETAEIDASACSDVRIVNNIAVNLNGKQAKENDGGTYAYNQWYWYGKTLANLGVAEFVADPMLTDPARGDFEPMAGSWALGSGTSQGAPTVDVYGNPRPADAVDRGAIQAANPGCGPRGSL